MAKQITANLLLIQMRGERGQLMETLLPHTADEGRGVKEEREEKTLEIGASCDGISWQSLKSHLAQMLLGMS